MRWKSLTPTILVALTTNHGATAQTVFYDMLRFQCNQLVVDRIDPLVNPGLAPSPHLHQIVGGNSFKPDMKPESGHDLVANSTCTSCTFSEDLSNYWTAVLYFKARNGTYRRVPQFVSEGLRGHGGITVYYIPPFDGKSKVTAFKPGFRMLAGDAAADFEDKRVHKLCHRCMPKSGDNSNVNCGAPDGKSLPSKPCEGGIRSVITFPTCWDGKNVDSPDHKSHVAYTATGSFDSNGNCPASHPVALPQVMLEVMWDTRIFNDPELWPEDGSQPFVWSTGDKTGYTQHGDYVFGWKGDSLQRAMDARCTGAICSQLKLQSSEEAMRCTKAPVVEEEVDGWLDHIPGMEHLKD